MKYGKKKISSQKKNPNFKPSRSYLKNAVEDYLSRGGKITKLKNDIGYYSGMTGNSNYASVSDFLNEKHTFDQKSID